MYYWSVNMGGSQPADSGDPPVDTDDYEFNFEGAFSVSFEGVYDNPDDIREKEYVRCLICLT